jgi:hypothetical protein
MHEASGIQQCEHATFKVSTHRHGLQRWPELSLVGQFRLRALLLGLQADHI